MMQMSTTTSKSGRSSKLQLSLRISRSTAKILGISFLIHVVLLVYADHVDENPERYGGLKYTDVDWRVVIDGAALIFRRKGGDAAQGWLPQRLGLNIGDPYQRQTFRYTPLLPILLSPALIHPLLGKLVLSLISLSVPLLLLWTPSGSATSSSKTFWSIHLLWTLNPFVLNITTRGSPEAIIVAIVAALLACLRRVETSRRLSTSTNEVQKWEDRASVVLALAVSYKIYPIIYVPSIWAFLAQQHGWFGYRIWRFGGICALTLGVVNGILWSIWGQPFLDQTFLYHLTRLDHRHNFSPYYYPVYLSLFSDSPSPSKINESIPKFFQALLDILRHPLSSFLPQATLVVFAGFGLTPRTGLPFAIFVQTVIFVVFNKVCTSQYFTWWIPLLALIIPNLHLSKRKSLVLLTAWIIAQAIWLGVAYQLEFKGRSVHLYLWAAGLGLFGVSVWVLGEIIDSWRPWVRDSKDAKVE